MTAEPFLKKATSFLSLSSWGGLVDGLTVGFSTKTGGVSNGVYSTLNLGLHVNDESKAVVTNRGILAHKVSFPIDNWVFAQQTHSVHIAKVTIGDQARGVNSYEDGLSNCDGLYTDKKGIMLSLCFADCVPLYFIVPKTPLIGVAHAGWKGTVNDIGGEMVRQWKTNEGINPKDIKVAIGPAIGPCCYIVDDRVISAIDKQAIQNYSIPYSLVSEGQYKLDLKQLNKYLLIASGVREENIIISQYCTSCETKLFFSHRRDKGKTGRMLSFIGIDKEA